MPEDKSKELELVNQEIYKRNLELAVVNKTLSLLRKLYNISLLSLNPGPLSEKISETVRVDLNYELVGIYKYDGSDKLSPFKFSSSERASKSLHKARLFLDTASLETVHHNELFRKIIHENKPAVSNNPAEVWGQIADEKKLVGFTLSSHIQSILLFPLLTQKTIIGCMVFGINREYRTLSRHEQDTLSSLVDVTAVALDNALLYEKLDLTNKQLTILDKARAEFISIASHQLRTPPATIKWYLAAVLDGDYGKLAPKVKDALLKAQLTNNNLINLIDDMLNASRIERGKMEFLFEYADFKTLTDNIVIQLTPQAKIKNLELVYNSPREKFPQILADKEKLSQVANNLIDNAIKYTKTGKVKVILSKTSSEIVLKVSDTGKGLTTSEKTSLFEKYGRGKDSQKVATGLGLGLYVAKVIVEHHKGKIWAESDGPGKGTTFIVSLPIKTDLKADTFDLTQNQASEAHK